MKVAKTKEIVVSVGITKALKKEYEFIRLDVGITKTIESKENHEMEYEKAWNEVQDQLLLKLGELHGNDAVNKLLP